MHATGLLHTHRKSEAAMEVNNDSQRLADAACTSPAELDAILAAGASVNCRDEGDNTPLHLAASADDAEACRWAPAAPGAERRLPKGGCGHCGPDCACRLLSGRGADALARNAKGKTPRQLAGLSAEVRDALLEAEEASKRRRAERQAQLWDDKMRATQTASACRLGCV